MVCSLGSGRMAVLARLLGGENLLQPSEEEFGRKKALVQYMRREFCDADEVNLLDEEDMHVFGLKPMDDPLHLVCCNACKKPIKASQYVAHAEMCRLFPTQEAVLEPAAVNKKPFKKGRKKLTAACAKQGAAGGGRGTCVFVDDVALGTQMDGNMEIPSSEVKAGLDAAQTVDDVVVHGSIDYPMAPPMKRTKLLPGEHLPNIDDGEPRSSVTRSRELSDGDAIGHRKPLQANTYGQLPIDVPAPLASKIYYSQRNNRLRLALGDLYHLTATSSPYRREDESLNFVQQLGHKPGKSNQFCLGNSTGPVSSIGVPDLVTTEASLIPQKAPVGPIKNGYFSKHFSFTGDSGKAPSMQQSSGSLPVL